MPRSTTDGTPEMSSLNVNYKNTVHTISNRHIQTKVHLLNFPLHTLWCLHYIGKDMHEGFQTHLLYPPFSEDNFTHNSKRLSIYGQKLTAILKLSYPQTEVA